MHIIIVACIISIIIVTVVATRVSRPLNSTVMNNIRGVSTLLTLNLLRNFSKAIVLMVAFAEEAYYWQINSTRAKIIYRASFRVVAIIVKPNSAFFSKHPQKPIDFQLTSFRLNSAKIAIPS